MCCVGPQALTKQFFSRPTLSGRVATDDEDGWVRKQSVFTRNCCRRHLENSPTGGRISVNPPVGFYLTTIYNSKKGFGVHADYASSFKEEL